MARAIVFRRKEGADVTAPFGTIIRLKLPASGGQVTSIPLSEVAAVAVVSDEPSDSQSAGSPLSGMPEGGRFLNLP